MGLPSSVFLGFFVGFCLFFQHYLHASSAQLSPRTVERPETCSQKNHSQALSKKVRTHTANSGSVPHFEGRAVQGDGDPVTGRQKATRRLLGVCYRPGPVLGALPHVTLFNALTVLEGICIFLSPLYRCWKLSSES